MGTRGYEGRTTLTVPLDRLGDDQLLRRFLEEADQDAFTAIVSRYGPRVLGVCRQVLGHSPDVDDAFQTTFLLLARKAGSIRDRSALGHWLHGVAHRTAVRSKVRSRRRESVSRIAVEPSSPRIEDDLDRQELRQVLHEEIDRLPDQFRRPVLLCYLDGRTNQEAARLLECPAGTMKSRLAHARETLRKRLARRGFALSAMLLLLLLSDSASAEPITARLSAITVEAAARSRSRRGGAASGSPGRLTARTPLLLAALAINLVATFVTLSHAKLAWPQWVGWLIAMARRACH